VTVAADRSPGGGVWAPFVCATLRIRGDRPATNLLTDADAPAHHPRFAACVLGPGAARFRAFVAHPPCERCRNVCMQLQL